MDPFIVTSTGSASNDPRDKQMHRALTTLGVLLTLTLACAKGHAAPVAEVRVDFDRNGITRTIERGVADRRSGRIINADDPVRIASISKLVVGIGVMRLVELGKLDLDRDVSDYLGWPLRHPRYPNVVVTLRLLLSHRSGLTDEAGYVSHTQTKTRELATTKAAWDPAHAPGTFFRYSNINFPIIAAIMERVTGERFDRLMQRLVLKPLDLTACYNWPTCPDSAITRAVVAYEANGEVGIDDLDGRRPGCPVRAAPDNSCDFDSVKPGENGGLFSPQGGLRISALGLAKIGRLLLRGGEVDGVRLLKEKSIAEILRPLWTYDGANGLTFETDVGNAGESSMCRYGIATQTLATRSALCKDDPWGDGIERVGHGGDAYGVISGLWLDLAGGKGVAYFISGGDTSQKGKRSAFYAIEENVLDH